MSISRWIDKEVVVHLHNGILLSYKKEHIWVCSNEVDEPRAYYTEWSKSEREGQILHINAYIWNLEKSFRRSYVPGSKGDTDIKIWTHWRRWEWMIWKNSTETCTLPYVNRWPVQFRWMKQSTRSQCSGTTQRDGAGRAVGGGFRMEGTRVPVADSCWCIAKTITIL